ncbi:MAG: cytochrome c biogenesis protein CcdA [Clostridia bacterium]|nr:cytochrome c biogenesis protein CcdA [Clostridia bacterium]
MVSFFVDLINQSLSGSLFIALPLIFVAGVITSFSPCILSMIPVLVGYVGGYSNTSRLKSFSMSFLFVLGLGVTFAILGITAASFGKVFGQIGSHWYIIMAVVAIVMGLQLLGVFQISFPGLKKLPVKTKGMVGSFLMGLFFGLVASPCATPVLAVIMTYLASKGDLVFGGVMLFAYGIGHGMPLLIAGTFTGAIKNLRQFQRYSQYVTYASAGILILLGAYLLSLVI